MTWRLFGAPGMESKSTISLALFGQNFFHRSVVDSPLPLVELHAQKPNVMLVHLLVAWVWMTLVTADPVKLTVMSGCGESEQP